MNKSDLADTLLLIKLNLIEENKNEKAVELLEKIVAKHPKSAEAFRLLGKAYYQKKDYDQSLENIFKACSIEPNYIDGMVQLLASARLNGTEKSLKKFDHAIELVPRCSLLYVVRGYLLMFNNRREDAILNYTKGINNNPTYWDLYFRRAWAYRIVGKIDEAIEDYEKGIELCPNLSESPDIFLQIASLYIEKHNFEKATTHLGRLFIAVKENIKEHFEKLYFVFEKEVF